MAKKPNAKKTAAKSTDAKGRNIVVLLDGTGNDIGQKDRVSNVLNLYRVLEKDEMQLVFYDTGVGTLTKSGVGGLAEISQFLGMATGWGIYKNLAAAYTFIAEHYREGDRLYLFGFSRGAYTARMLAAILHTVGIISLINRNLFWPAVVIYASGGAESIDKGFRLRRILQTKKVEIEFLGVWDTVASVWNLRLGIRNIFNSTKLPYTMTNPSIRCVRQASAIDEFRRHYRLYHWNTSKKQDVKQVWFAGAHSDVGGGYPEAESGLSKLALEWMVHEAQTKGLRMNEKVMHHVIYNAPIENGKSKHQPPDWTAKVHVSLRHLFPLFMMMEWFPKFLKYREWPCHVKKSEAEQATTPWYKADFPYVYLPCGEPRCIEAGAIIHESAVEKFKNDDDYSPENFPKEYDVEPRVKL